MCESGMHTAGGEYKPTPTQYLLNVRPALPHARLQLRYQGCSPIIKSLKKSFIRLLKFLKNKTFVSQGLKKILIFWAANFSVEMCVVVKRPTPISIC